jgi:hypothetical protein
MANRRSTTQFERAISSCRGLRPSASLFGRDPRPSSISTSSRCGRTLIVSFTGTCSCPFSTTSGDRRTAREWSTSRRRASSRRRWRFLPWQSSGGSWRRSRSTSPASTPPTRRSVRLTGNVPYCEKARSPSSTIRTGNWFLCATSLGARLCSPMAIGWSQRTKIRAAQFASFNLLT